MSRTSFVHSVLCYVTDRYYIANKTANTSLLTLIMRVSSIEPASLQRIHVAIQMKDWIILYRVGKKLQLHLIEISMCLQGSDYAIDEVCVANFVKHLDCTE